MFWCCPGLSWVRLLGSTGGVLGLGLQKETELALSREGTVEKSVEGSGELAIRAVDMGTDSLNYIMWIWGPGMVGEYNEATLGRCVYRAI